MAILGHDPLEAAHPGGLEEGDPLPRDVLAEANARIGLEDAGKQPAAFLERLGDQGPAVEVEQVEGLEDEGAG